MFFTLIFIVILSTVGITLTDNRNSTTKIFRLSLYSIIAISIFLICSYLATVGLVFNIKMPDTDFSTTINANFIIILLINVSCYAIIATSYIFISRKLNIKTYWLIILLFIIAIAVYYPGIPSADGDNSYNQYLNHSYSDWQPPLFTIWWLLFSFKGATFLIDSFAYYIGLAYISYYLEQKNLKLQSNIIFLFSINPILFSQLAIVWKDIGYTAFLIDLVAIYLALDIVKQKLARNALWCLYYVCIFLVIAFRANGVFAVLPFIYLSISKLISSNKLLHKFYSLFLSIVIIVIMLGINQFVIYKVLNAEKSYPQEAITLSDTAYINCEVVGTTKINDIFFYHLNADDNDIICNQALNYYNLDAMYNDWNNWGVPYRAPIKPVPTKEANSIATQQWIAAVTNNPSTYLEVRSKIFINILFNQYWYPTANETSTQNLLSNISQYQHKDMKFLFPLLVIISLTVMLGMHWTRKSSTIATAITISSILQLFGWFFLLPAHPARYFFWNDVAAILSLLLISINKTQIEKINLTTQAKNNEKHSRTKVKNKNFKSL